MTVISISSTPDVVFIPPDPPFSWYARWVYFPNDPDVPNNNYAPSSYSETDVNGSVYRAHKIQLIDIPPTSYR